MRNMFRAYPRHSVRFSCCSFVMAIYQLIKGYSKKIDFTDLFEKKFAEYIGVKYAVAVSSCRIGIYLGLKEMNLKDGDEVIMPAYTFKGVVFSVRAAGLNPVFVDIKETDCNINEDVIEDKITSRSKVLLISHMYGFPCNMGKIMDIARKNNIKIIEDVALSCGAEYKNIKIGSFGSFGVFSFGIGKNLSCLGGGMVTTNDEKLYNWLKDITNKLPYPNWQSIFLKFVKYFICYVLTSYPVFTFITFPAIFLTSVFNMKYFDFLLNEEINMRNFRSLISKQSKFINLQAIIGLSQLGNLDSYNKKIYDNALQYDSMLKDKLGPCFKFNPEDIKPTRHYYIIQHKERSAFIKKLLFFGIDTQPDDMSNCSKLGVNLSDDGMYPNTEKALRENIEIPNIVNLREDSLSYISKRIKNIY